MADNKLMNRYYPPDFDPSKLLPVKAIRPKRSSNRQMAIRMMFPFTMCCSHCGEYLYIGTKFNSRCEKIQGTTELGLNAYRFYGNCKHCKGEFTFRTDPEHSDYVLESGGTRAYEAHKDANLAEAELEKSKADQEAESESKALENKIYDTAEEMRKIEELGELRSLNKREAKRHEAIHLAIEKLTQEAFLAQQESDRAVALEADEERELEEEFRQLKRRAINSEEQKSVSDKIFHSQKSGKLGFGLKIKVKKDP